MIRLTLISCCLLLVSSVRVTSGQETVQWKLAPGDELHYEIETSLTVSLGEPATHFMVDQKLVTTWNIQSVDEEGMARVHMTIDRIVLLLDDPLGKMEYDSAKDEQPGSVAALAGPILRGLLEHPITFLLSTRGEINEVDIDSDFLEAIKNSALSDPLQGFTSAEGIKNLLFSGMPIFPESLLEVGEEWTATSDLVNPQFGPQEVKTVCRFVGNETNDGEIVAQVISFREFVLDEKENIPVKILAHESSGKCLFNRTKGRMESNNWNTQLKLSVNDGNTNNEGNLQQSYEMKQVPAE